MDNQETDQNHMDGTDVYCACVRFDEISGQDKELKTSKGISIEKPKINLACMISGARGG